MLLFTLFWVSSDELASNQGGVCTPSLFTLPTAKLIKRRPCGPLATRLRLHINSSLTLYKKP